MDAKCKDRIQENFDSRMDDINKLIEWESKHDEEYHPDLGRLNDYGLCFDYVEPDTFQDQEAGYYRWQLSWGGPSDEFRFYVDDGGDIQEIEYWFLDWFDGANISVNGEDANTLIDLWNWYIKDLRMADE